MQRRAVLASGGAAITAGLAGCLGSVFGGSPGATDDVVLEAPERYEDLRESRDNGDLAHPIHADPLPGVEMPDALAGESMSTREYVGDRHVMLTFVFSRCSMVCPGLVADLIAVQADSLENGYDEEIAFMPTTFDPEYDTPARLETFSRDLGAEMAAGNWHFLRPEGRSRAEEVVEGEFGVWHERLSAAQREERDMPDNMVWDHVSAIVLANADGYIERTYTGSRRPNKPGLIDDVETLRERW